MIGVPVGFYFGHAEKERFKLHKNQKFIILKCYSL